MYLLKKSGGMFYKHFREYLFIEGYTNDAICPCLFIKRKTLMFVVLDNNVDDINLRRTMMELKKTIDYLMNEFEIKYHGTKKLCHDWKIQH